MMQQGSQYMPLQTPSSTKQDRPSGCEHTPNTTGRFRSSCDPCYQSKIRCSGGTPCSACQGSPSWCTYSPGNRLGRPKGSKNKRTLMQKNSNERTETQEDTTRTSRSADVVQWTDFGRQQQQRQQQQQQPRPPPPPPSLDSTSFEFDLDDGNDTGFLESLVVDSNRDLTLDSNLGLIGSVSTQDNLNLQALFAQTSSALSGYSFPALSSETPEFSEYDSSYATSNITPSTEDAALSSPRSAIFPGSNMNSGPPRCSCLQRLVKLLYHLEDLRYSHGSSSGPAIDSILRGVKFAEIPWKSIMQCSACQNEDNHKEALLLFAMSIRILLLSVQKLNGSPGPTDVSSDVAISVGSFELTGEVKTEVMGVAIRRALEAITAAILHLSGRTGRSSLMSLTDPGSSSSNILTKTSKESQKPLPNSGAENIPSLLDTLQYTMKATEEEFKTSA